MIRLIFLHQLFLPFLFDGDDRYGRKLTEAAQLHQLLFSPAIAFLAGQNKSRFARLNFGWPFPVTINPTGKGKTMKLFTKQQYERLIKNGSDDNHGKDHKPVVKLFLTASGATWLLTELSNDPETPKLAFGLCDLGIGFPEIGYVDLDELLTLHNPSKLRFLERDRYFEGSYPLSVYVRAAVSHECIIESESELSKFVK